MVLDDGENIPAKILTKIFFYNIHVLTFLDNIDAHKIAIPYLLHNMYLQNPSCICLDVVSKRVIMYFKNKPAFGTERK